MCVFFFILNLKISYNKVGFGSFWLFVSAALLCVCVCC